MLLIFDSYDCAGKTPIATEISKRCKIPFPKQFQNQVPNKKLTNKEYYLWSMSWHFAILSVLKSGNELNLIVDRFIQSEYCYAPILRQYSINDYYWRYDSDLMNLPVLWIYPTIEDPNWKEILKKRYDEKKESYITFDQLLTIKQSYDELFENSKVKKLKIDSSNMTDLKKIINDLLLKLDTYTNIKYTL